MFWLIENCVEIICQGYQKTKEKKTVNLRSVKYSESNISKSLKFS